MFLYRITISCYYLGILASSLLSEKSRKWINGRRDWKKKLNHQAFDGQWIWFHCSSYGEFNDGRSLIEAVKTKFPQYKILLTFFSPSGYLPAMNYEHADLVFYLPLDTRRNAKYFLDRVKPKIALFIRNDVWPGYIRALQHRQIPAFLCSFALSKQSKFLKFPLRTFYRDFFSMFRAIFVQNEKSNTLLRSAAFSNTVIASGNSRVDLIMENLHRPFADEKIEKFVDGKFCVIAGSTLPEDRNLFLGAVSSLGDNDIKWIIAPHDVDEHEIRETKTLLGGKMMLYSDTTQHTEPQILWIDNVGMLSKIYRYADLAMIGGGFDPIGIHSIIEPAAYGCAVCFGPNHRNFYEALELLAYGGAEIIRNKQDLIAFILKYRENKDRLDKMKEANKDYVKQQTGATNKIMNFLVEQKILL